MEMDHMTTQCRSVQRMLRRVGYRNPVDGVDSDQTRRSIQCFQRDLKLPATGIVDDTTLAKLAKCYANASKEVRHER